MKNENELPLRLGVGIALLNHENKVFVGKRIDNPANSWQMPQGGVDKNENLLNAAFRELREETGVKNVKLIKEIDTWLTYDLPKNLLGKLWNGKYKGEVLNPGVLVYYFTVQFFDGTEYFQSGDITLVH